VIKVVQTNIVGKNDGRIERVIRIAKGLYDIDRQVEIHEVTILETKTGV
jgi:hypothetical protein